MHEMTPQRLLDLLLGRFSSDGMMSYGLLNRYVLEHAAALDILIWLFKSQQCISNLPCSHSYVLQSDWSVPCGSLRRILTAK